MQLSAPAALRLGLCCVNCSNKNCIIRNLWKFPKHYSNHGLKKLENDHISRNKKLAFNTKKINTNRLTHFCSQHGTCISQEQTRKLERSHNKINSTLFQLLILAKNCSSIISNNIKKSFRNTGMKNLKKVSVTDSGTSTRSMTFFDRHSQRSPFSFIPVTSWVTQKLSHIACQQRVANSFSVR